MRVESVSAIVVTYHPDKVKLRNLILSLCEQCGRVYLVDNNSPNFNSDFIQDNLEFFSLKNNLGIAAAQNLGLKSSIDAGFQHTIIFDQDSQIPENLIEILLQEITEFPDCAAIGPSFRNIDDGVIYPQVQIKHGLPRLISIKNDEQSIDVSYVIASGCLINNDILVDIGLMKEDLFIDFVDIEWCLRAIHKGYKIKATNKVCIEHYIGDERKKILGKFYSQHSPIRRYYMARNAVLLSRLDSCPKLYGFYLVTLGLMKNFLHSLFFGEGLKHFQMSVKGFFDGVRGISGKL